MKKTVLGRVIRGGLWACIAAAVGVCGGCGQKAPRFTVTDIAITDSTPEATTLRVTLVGVNENSEPLPLYEIRYSMAVDGQEVKTARRSPEATLPAKGSQAFTFPVVVPVEAMPAELMANSAYRVWGSVTYELPGTIAQLFFDNNIRRPSQGFGESGSFSPDGAVSSGSEAPPAE